LALDQPKYIPSKPFRKSLQGRRHLTTPAAFFSVIMITQKNAPCVAVITYPEGADGNNHRG